MVYKDAEFRNVDWLLSFLKEHLNDTWKKRIEEDPDAVLPFFLMRLCGKSRHMSCALI
ncbi:hypothetical protein GsuE55_36990 (plasmid) [Geobacillus subterraneus]|uniref:Uncharacterized protein n=1 Tax=Geobacillus subterraneus TaxID=129338 RepID=A0A679FYR4_9BACL|nr:hypothetical protein GsuE55_36990 [Geobacillus subterraneus]